MTNNNKEIILTIFTPSYNRAHLLQRLYESLLTQKSKNFIWLIVDDGSTDDTQELIDSYIKQNKINIEYVYQKNCGKYIAHNVAAFHAETKLFCTVDSDDVVLGNAVDTIISKWKN